MNSEAIRSKGNKKIRRLKRHSPMFDKKNMSERNKVKMDELKRLEVLRREQNARLFNKIFSKNRIITYLCLVILPPYGLYRIWHKNSTFNKIEKYLWTFIFVMFIVKLIT